MQTAIYLRISQDHTGEQRSTTGQLEDCRALADQLGWIVYDEYADRDVSATKRDRHTKKLKVRPEYERMLADIKADRVGAVVTWHTDRLYRTTKDLDPLIDILEDYGVRVATVKAGQFDLGTPTGRMIARILASVAQGEVEMKADRWERSVRQQRERGKMPRPGGAVIRLFGQTPEGNLIDPEVQAANRMADHVIAGGSLRGLAAELHADGITTVAGNAWKPQVIRSYLLNPRIAGYATLGRDREILGRVEGPSILPDDKWQVVRSLLMARARPAVPRVALLAGIIYCGGCEEPMTTGGVYRKGRRVRTYRCWARPGFDNCGGVSTVAEPVEDIAEGVAKTLLSGPEVRHWLATARAGGQEHILAELDAQERRLAEIAHAIAEGSLSAAVGGQAEKVVRGRIESLENQLAVTSPTRIPKDTEVDWPTDLGARRRLVDLVVARVWVDPAKVRGGRFDPRRVRVDPSEAVRQSGE